MSDITFIGAPGTEYPIREIKMYSDSTTMVKTEDFERIVAECDTVLLRPYAMSSLLAGLSVVDGVHAHGGRIENLLLPYLPGARQDRANSTGDVGFMLATIAKLLNSYEFHNVLVVDPHSRVMGDWVDSLRVFPYDQLYSFLPHDYDAVIAPDAGAGQRAMLAAKTLGIPWIQAEKHRDPSNGKLSGFGVEVEAGKHYVVVDDICDGGGTFVGLGEKITEQGATADLFVAHGIFSKGTRELHKYYTNIMTTNTRARDIEGPNYFVDQIFDVLTEMKKAVR